jgi:hypothetical protein
MEDERMLKLASLLCLSLALVGCLKTPEQEAKKAAKNIDNSLTAGDNSADRGVELYQSARSRVENGNINTVSDADLKASREEFISAKKSFQNAIGSYYGALDIDKKKDDVRIINGGNISKKIKICREMIELVDAQLPLIDAELVLRKLK